jgi:hypothetical protein
LHCLISLNLQLKQQDKVSFTVSHKEKNGFWKDMHRDLPWTGTAISSCPKNSFWKPSEPGLITPATEGISLPATRMQEFSYSIIMGPCHFCHTMPCPPHPHCRTPGRITANKAESSKICLCWISLLPLKKHRQSNPVMFHNRKCYGTKWTKKQEICEQIWTGELVYRQTMLLWHISLSRKTSENECLGRLKVRFEQMYTSVYQHNTTQTESCSIQ